MYMYAVCVEQHVAHGTAAVPASAYLAWPIEISYLCICVCVHLVNVGVYLVKTRVYIYI